MRRKKQGQPNRDSLDQYELCQIRAEHAIFKKIASWVLGPIFGGIGLIILASLLKAAAHIDLAKEMTSLIR
jgi:hypothetical protein